MASSSRDHRPQSYPQSHAEPPAHLQSHYPSQAHHPSHPPSPPPPALHPPYHYHPQHRQDPQYQSHPPPRHHESPPLHPSQHTRYQPQPQPYHPASHSPTHTPPPHHHSEPPAHAPSPAYTEIDDNNPPPHLPPATPEQPTPAPDPEGPLSTGNLYRQYCNLVGIPEPPRDHPFHAAWSKTLYARVLGRHRRQRREYGLTLFISNTLLLLQILIGAVVTALAASKSPHVIITVFGAVNTVVAGVVAYIKSRGQPMRSRMYRDELGKCLDGIWDAEGWFLGVSEGVDGFGGGGGGGKDGGEDDGIERPWESVSVREAVEKLTVQYETAVEQARLNYPDLWASAGKQGQKPDWRKPTTTTAAGSGYGDGGGEMGVVPAKSHLSYLKAGGSPGTPTKTKAGQSGTPTKQSGGGGGAGVPSKPTKAPTKSGGGGGQTMGTGTGIVSPPGSKTGAGGTPTTTTTQKGGGGGGGGGGGSGSAAKPAAGSKTTQKDPQSKRGGGSGA